MTGGGIWERLPASWEVENVDTTDLSPAEAAARVLAWCRTAVPPLAEPGADAG